jgi:preprotein translocase subunit SecF
MGIVHRLYHGDTTFPLIKARRKFYAISIILVLISLGSMAIRQFNLGVEFKGGSIFTVPVSSNVDVGEARDFVHTLGVGEAIVQTLKSSGGDTKLRFETEPLDPEEQTKVLEGLAAHYKVDADTQIDTREVGASWGKQVTNKALQGLLIFLVAVVIYISIRFEPKMAAAAIVALIHDLILAAGIYSITQFVVTPSTIIALLTVLGYSLYDTIVVFDKVEENTRGLERGNTQTYSEASELAVNQTFMRSINTSLIALLPVSGLLFVGALLLGAGTLKDLALALFVGLGAGAYSSLFLATPLLADLKEREPRFQALHTRVLQRRGSGGGAAAPVRLSERSANVSSDLVTEEPPAATPAPAATAVRRQPSPQAKRSKKGGRPKGKSGKRKR